MVDFNDIPVKLTDVKFEGISDKEEEEFLKRALLQFQKSHCCFPCKYQKVYLFYFDDKIANYLKPDDIVNLCLHPDFASSIDKTIEGVLCYERCPKWEDIE